MECAIHSGQDAAGVCCRCGRPVCEVCGTETDGLQVCSRCQPATDGGATGKAEPSGPGVAGAASAAAGAATPADLDRRRRSPALAALLAVLFPPLGALYNRQWLKALVYLAVFIGLVQLTAHETGLVLALMAFYFYRIYDAHRTAVRINTG